MPIEVILPKVDMDMEAGKISAWHVAEGDHVDQGDPLFDIETDKAAMEVESPGSGHLHHITAEVGTEVPIGQAVAWLYAEGETVPNRPPETIPATLTAQEPAKPVVEPATPAKEASTHDGQRATPAARKLAYDAGLPLGEITGTGPRERVQKSDVEARLNNTPAASPAEINWAAEAAPLNILKSGISDGTPWLLIHGLGADANSWEFIEKSLSKTAPVLRLELPCHGKSPHQKVDSFAHLGAIVRAAFDDLNLPKVRLIGHSLGGALALALADTRPRHIETLTLLSPAGLGPQINGDILDGILRASTTASLGPWLRMMMGDSNRLTENYISAAMLARRDPKLRRAQYALQKAVFPDHTQAFDLTAALNRVTCPTRIVFGKKDQVIPWQHALQAPGQVGLHLFAEMGHLPAFEDPDAVLALL